MYELLRVFINSNSNYVDSTKIRVPKQSDIFYSMKKANYTLYPDKDNISKAWEELFKQD